MILTWQAPVSWVHLRRGCLALVSASTATGTSSSLGFQTDMALTWLWLPLHLLPRCFESVFSVWGGRAGVCGDGLQSWDGVFLTLLHLTRNWQLPWRLFQLPFISPFPSSSFWDFSGCVHSMQLSCKVVFQGKKKDILVFKSSFENA